MTHHTKLERLKRLQVWTWKALYLYALKKWRRASGHRKVRRVSTKVTDHAIVRYAERIDGYDIKKALAILESSEVRTKVADIGGTGKFTMHGVVFTVDNGIVLTVAKAEGANSALVYRPLTKTSDIGQRWSF